VARQTDSVSERSSLPLHRTRVRRLGKGTALLESAEAEGTLNTEVPLLISARCTRLPPCPCWIRSPTFARPQARRLRSDRRYRRSPLPDVRPQAAPLPAEPRHRPSRPRHEPLLVARKSMPTMPTAVVAAAASRPRALVAVAAAQVRGHPRAVLPCRRLAATEWRTTAWTPLYALRSIASMP